MKNIYDIINNNVSSGGLQNVEIHNDTLLFNFKNEINENWVLIEKIDFNYDTVKIESIKNGIFINFGDTGFDEANKTSGNMYVGSVQDNSVKYTYIVGISSDSIKTVPVIYSYNNNSHEITPVLKFSDVTNLYNASFVTSSIPSINYDGDRLKISFQTVSSFDILNLFDVSIKKNICNINSIQLLTGFNSSDIIFDNINSQGIGYTYQSFNNILVNK